MFFPRYVLFTTFETGDDEHNPQMPDKAAHPALHLSKSE
jgi:hypothetical protein